MANKWNIGDSVIYRSERYSFPGEVVGYAYGDAVAVVKAYGDAEGFYTGMTREFMMHTLEPYTFGDDTSGRSRCLVIFPDENPVDKMRDFLKHHSFPALATLMEALDEMASMQDGEEVMLEETHRVGSIEQRNRIYGGGKSGGKAREEIDKLNAYIADLGRAYTNTQKELRIASEERDKHAREVVRLERANNKLRERLQNVADMLRRY